MSVTALRKITHKRVIVICATDTTHSNLTTISHISVCEQEQISILTSQKERDNKSSVIGYCFDTDQFPLAKLLRMKKNVFIHDHFLSIKIPE